MPRLPIALGVLWSRVRVRAARRRLPHPLTLTMGTLLAVGFGGTSPLHAAKLTSVSVLDREHLLVHFLDGEVSFGTDDQQSVVRYGTALGTSAAAQTASWLLKSSDDGNYGSAGRRPLNVYRKTKLSGHAQMEWSGSDYRYESTYQHWMILRLPSAMQQGRTYTLEIAAATNTDRTSQTLTFDVFNSRSEAVHVNLVGYAADASHNGADLYYWMGDGGARDYGGFEGSTVYLYNVATGATHNAGYVSYWKPGGADVGGYNLTRSAVWSADFSSAGVEPGTYRLAVEGVGCSQDFVIASDAYADPFRVSLRGFFYMRLGQANGANLQPAPRTPLYLPGSSPSNTTVYLTTVQPWDGSWSSIPADQWDNPNSWAAYRKPGNPTNPNAWGGHSDAYDWDRHLGHVSIIYDMLLPFIITRGALRDDATGIAESGNGVPDVIDEARNEVDFWLRLRDGAGYAHGLTNPNSNNELFQAAPTAIAAWANAANAAMLAEAYRVAGQTSLMEAYRNEAVTAYNHANGLADPMLDATQNVGEGSIRGRDLKMTAAAFLYNLTGNSAYEAVVNAESVCTSASAELENGSRNQIWATAGYLFTNRTVHYPTLWDNMKASVTAEAYSKEVDLSDSRPSRRSTDNRTGYFRTIQNVQRTLIAHAIATDAGDKEALRRALALEADWGLGRNPLNTIQMTTAWTPLEGKRSIVNMYTTGRDDGVRGVHPGHTPYLNLDDWYCGMTMGCPSALAQNAYPASFTANWPIDEGYFDSRWVWAHSEFTPQQTMRGKTALYGYLLAISGAPSTTATLAIGKSGAGSGSVTSSPAGIDCGSDCSESFATGTIVTLTAQPASGSRFAGWSGACSGTGGCVLTMDAARSVTASFDTAAVARTTYGNDGNPWTIGSGAATRIQAENYDTGGEGVAYHDEDGTNSGNQYRTNEAVDVESTSGGGYNVGYVGAGEWLEYTVNVAAAGTFDLKLRVARQPSGNSAVKVLLGGADKTGDLSVPSTGGWQTWMDLTKNGVSLSAGPQVLRIAMVGAEFNVDWIEITPVATQTYALSVSKAGTGTGTVSSAPAGVSCGSDCSETFASGTGVTLTATPASGSVFAGWSGACSGTGSCTIVMSANRSATATFDPSSAGRCTYPSSASCEWAVSASAATRIQAENYDSGGEGVAYHDNDSANSGGQYRAEGVDIEAASDTGGGYNLGYLAPGEWVEYTVNVASAGSYDLKLRVARQTSGTSATRILLGGADKTGELIVPSTGGWQTWADLVKTGVNLSAGRQLLRLAMVGGEFNVNWIEITPVAAPSRTLTVSKAGSGGGTVASSPAGVSCGSDCSESYANGTSVTLTASAAIGSAFSGWSGACSGSGACTVIMDAARSVTATFDVTTSARTTYGNDGSPWAIASSGTTRIEAENYDVGGEGVAYHDDDAPNNGNQYRTSEGVDVETTVGGGYNVGWVAAGEWLEYSVNVAVAGTYDLKLRLSRQPAGSSTVRVLFAGVDKTGDLVVPSTGAWQTWTDVTKAGVSLSAGLQVVRVALVGGDVNFNWLEVTKSAGAPALVLYDDALAPDWSTGLSWSATIDVEGSSPVRAGTRAIDVTYSAWGGLSLGKSAAFSATAYTAIRFWVHGGSGASKSLRVFTQPADVGGESTAATITAPANTWTEITVPLSALGNPASIKRVNIQDNNGGTQPVMTFDDVRLVP